jgi:nuclear pore complex protein Nup155
MQAFSLLCAQVPLSCDLGQVVKQLAHLGCWDGLLNLPLRRAAAVDPEVAARLPGEVGRAAREVRPTS